MSSEADVAEAIGLDGPVLNILHVLDEPKTEPEIHEETGHSPATVNRWKNQLLDAGLIEPAGGKSPGLDPNRTRRAYVRTVDELRIDLDGETQDSPICGPANG